MERRNTSDFQVLENAFSLKFGYLNTYYIQNFLFLLGFLSYTLWLLISGKFSINTINPSYFAVGLNYLIFMTILSRWLPLGAKKLMVIIIFFAGFLTMEEWLNYELVSVQSFFASLLYLMVVLWSYGLAQNLANFPHSYRVTLLGLIPVPIFGSSLMFLRNPSLLIYFLIPYLVFLLLFKTYTFRKMSRFIGHLPEFPFFLPEFKQKSFFDIFLIPKYYSATSDYNRTKTKSLYLCVHL